MYSSSFPKGSQEKRHSKARKNDVIDEWPNVKDGIFNAVDYIRSHLRIPVSHLMPYNGLLVPLCYFFLKNEGRMPTVRQDKYLQQYFFWVAVRNRFTSGIDGKIAVDLGKMDEVLEEREPDYQVSRLA